METLVEKIKKEWAVFETNANAVVEKGNKAAVYALVRLLWS